MKNKKTIFALLWMVLSTGLGKFSSLIAQVVLGWVLAKSDFGLYALAISISSSVALLRNGGAQQILIQRGEEYDVLAPIIMKFSMLFNLLACLLLVIAAPFAADFYQQAELIVMINVIAILIPFSTVNNIFRAKLLIRHDFRAISIIDMSSGILRQGSTIIFALLDFGYMSFIWPILIEVLFTIIISYLFVKEFPKVAVLTWSVFKNIFKDSKWIMLGALAVALGYSGQYFVIGIFEDTANLGIYFFGFQLVTSAAVIFTYAIETVFFPMLSTVKGNNEAMRNSYTKTIYVIVFFAVPLSVLCSFFIKDLITYIWHSKWDDAVNVVEPMILTIPALMTLAINRSILEANGLWGQRLMALGFYVLGDMCVAGIAAWHGDIYLIAVASSTFRIIATLIQCIHVSVQIRLRIRRILNIALPSVIFSLISYYIALFLSKNYNIYDYDFSQNQYIIGFLFISSFFMFHIIFERKKIYRFLVNDV
jgi:teichuronic acid exporter